MKICCSYCPKEQTFRKSEDIKDIAKNGWSVVGLNMVQNEYYWICLQCGDERKSRPKITKSFDRAENL